MTDHKRYSAVNDQWPETIPALDGDEAIAAARRLYRLVMKKAWRGKWALTSGRRYTWPRRGVFYVNPARTGWGVVNGWHDLVHLMSHYCHRQLFPNHKPHHGTHHFIEKEMVAHVIKSGWLDGKLKPKPKAVAPKPRAAVSMERTAASIRRWESKSRRAANALKKLRRRLKAQQRRAA